MNKKLGFIMLVLVFILFLPMSLYASDTESLTSANPSESSISPTEVDWVNAEPESPEKGNMGDEVLGIQPNSLNNPVVDSVVEVPSDAADSSEGVSLENKGNKASLAPLDTKATPDKATGKEKGPGLAKEGASDRAFVGDGSTSPLSADAGQNPQKTDADKPAPQPSMLEDLAAQIEAEKDPKKEQELQKKYNTAYLQEIVAASKEKLDQSILNRFSDDARINMFYDLQKSYQDILEKEKRVV